MSDRTFEITGNFTRYGKWSIPDPSFCATIILQNGNYFEGYFRPKYRTKIQDDRFICGYYDEIAGKIAFYHFYESERYNIAVYIYNLESKNGLWCALELDSLIVKGKIKIDINPCRDISYEDEEYKVAMLRRLVSCSNDQFVSEQTEVCKKLLKWLNQLDDFDLSD